MGRPGGAGSGRSHESGTMESRAGARKHCNQPEERRESHPRRRSRSIRFADSETDRARRRAARRTPRRAVRRERASRRVPAKRERGAGGSRPDLRRGRRRQGPCPRLRNRGDSSPWRRAGNGKRPARTPPRRRPGLRTPVLRRRPGRGRGRSCGHRRDPDQRRRLPPRAQSGLHAAGPGSASGSPPGRAHLLPCRQGRTGRCVSRRDVRPGWWLASDSAARGLPVSGNGRARRGDTERRRVTGCGWPPAAINPSTDSPAEPTVSGLISGEVDSGQARVMRGRRRRLLHRPGRACDSRQGEEPPDSPTLRAGASATAAVVRRACSARIRASSLRRWEPPLDGAAPNPGRWQRGGDSFGRIGRHRRGLGKVGRGGRRAELDAVGRLPGGASPEPRRRGPPLRASPSQGTPLVESQPRRKERSEPPCDSRSAFFCSRGSPSST